MNPEPKKANTMLFQPEIIVPSKEASRHRLDELLRQPGLQVVDTLTEQYDELSEVTGNKYPEPGRGDGVWCYYSWKNTIVHILSKVEYNTLRQSRNFLLLTPEEQAVFRGARIGIAGLNVGNPAALCIALESGGEKMKFADFDTLSVSNLNRFRSGVTELGMNKAVLSARQVYEVDPFADIDVWEQGILPGQEKQFLLEPRIDVLVEEMDNVKLKVTMREAAREAKIPVVMVTGNGANVIIDIERYDLDANLPLLNGYLKESVVQRIQTADPRAMSVQERAQLARDFMGKEFLTTRLNLSFEEIGTTLAGIPQVAESSFLRGAAVCYAVRRIVTGADMPSGRYVLNLEDISPLS